MINRFKTICQKSILPIDIAAAAFVPNKTWLRPCFGDKILCY